MKKEIKDLWVKALESGDYPQGTGQLRSPKGLCCLAVLCDLHAREHPEIAERQKDPAEYLGETHTLPRVVMAWAGMTSSEGDLYSPKGLTKAMRDSYHTGDTSLAALNDAHFTFKQIARVIRKNWREL